MKPQPHLDVRWGCGLGPFFWGAKVGAHEVLGSSGSLFLWPCQGKITPTPPLFRRAAGAAEKCWLGYGFPLAGPQIEDPGAPKTSSADFGLPNKSPRPHPHLPTGRTMTTKTKFHNLLSFINFYLLGTRTANRHKPSPRSLRPYAPSPTAVNCSWSFAWREWKCPIPVA